MYYSGKKKTKTKGKNSSIGNKEHYIVKHVIMDNIQQYKEVAMICVKDKLLSNNGVFLTLANLTRQPRTK